MRIRVHEKKSAESNVFIMQQMFQKYTIREKIEKMLKNIITRVTSRTSNTLWKTRLETLVRPFLPLS